MNKILKYLIIFFILTSNAYAQKVAVTDLAYSEEVQGYIHIVDYHNKSNVNASHKESAAGDSYGFSAGSKTNFNANSRTDYFEYEQNYSYIEYGELRGFTGDIKGELIKSRYFNLVQAKPVTGIKNEKIYDIIERIKKGYYPGADFVLFGSVNDINFSDDTYRPQGEGRTMVNQIFNLTIAAEFSLVNTKTYQVVASFTAMGDGSDTKVQSSGIYSKPNRARVVTDASKSLGKDVIKQLDEQYMRINADYDHNYPSNLNDQNDFFSKKKTGVTVFH